MRWSDGVLTAAAAQPDGTVRRSADDVFLDLLDYRNRRGQRLSDSKHAGMFAPKAFASSPEAEGYTIRDFEKAMQRLFAAGRIRMRDYGSPSRCMRYLVAEQPGDPDTKAAADA